MMSLPTCPKFQVTVLVCAMTATALTGCGHKTNAAKPTGVFTGTCYVPASFDAVPTNLTDTGCFSTNGEAAAALVGYDVAAPLWADGAGKDRWLLTAEGASVSIDANANLQLPPSSALFKEFGEGGVRFETRLLMRNAKGAWQGFSYAWNTAQTQATLLPGGATKTVAGKSWTYPGRADCMSCHNEVAGSALGFALPQLDHTHDAGDGHSANQLDTLMADGVITGAVPTDLQPWQNPLGDAPLAVRARSYLAANCSFCHRPGGQSGTQTDFRFETPLANMGLCNVAPTRGPAGLTDPMLINPGQPQGSVLSARMHSEVDGVRMPPIGRVKADTEAAAVVDAWITSLTGCQEAQP